MYYLPFYYSFYTRIKEIQTKFSFILTFYLPVLILSLEVSDYSATSFYLTNLLFLILLLTYEIGYIYNDIHSTRFENNPTLRLNKEQTRQFDHTYPIHIALRVVLISVMILIVNSHFEGFNFIFVFLMSLLNLSYSFHNYFRGNENVLTIFLLMFFKYLSIPLSLAGESSDFYYLLGFIFLLPLNRTLAFTSHKKISYSFIDKDRLHQFRVKYFFVASLIIGVCSYFIGNSFSLFFLSFLYFMFYLFGHIVRGSGALFRKS
jgi:hypothetical protein